MDGKTCSRRSSTGETPVLLVSNRRRGISLLEVMLALALSAIVLGVLWAAVDIHARTVDRGRAAIEQGQLARTLLRKIADDLRSTIVFLPADVSGLAEYITEAGVPGGSDAILGSGDDTEGVSDVIGTGESSSDAESTAEGSSDTGATDGASDLESDGGSLLSGGASDLISQAAGDAGQQLADSLTPTEVPGLFGNQFTLQVDVSHLPRVDQYQTAMNAPTDGPRDQTSDVKTVAYFVIPPNATGASGRAPGLYRREVDRAITKWASTQGSISTLDAAATPIAPEVTAIEFRYFDGSTWTATWDSNAAGGPPLAVEIAIALATQPTAPVSSTWLGGSSTPQTQQVHEQIYRLVVHLPGATLAQGTTGVTGATDTGVDGDTGTTSSDTTSNSSAEGTNNAR